MTGASTFALIGDQSHNSNYIRLALTATLVEDAGITIDFTDEDKLLTAETLHRYQMLIIFRDGLRFPNGYWHGRFSNENKDEVVSVPPLRRKIGDGYTTWITQEQGRAIRQWVSGGGSLWAYHNCNHVSLSNADFRHVEGAVFTGHPEVRPYKVKVVNHDHPITRDVSDFVIHDEQHFMTFEKDPKYVLARSVNEDGIEFTDDQGRTNTTAEAVWAYDYGKGRVCYTAPGHQLNALWNPEYEKLQQNAARWLLRET